MNAVRWEGLDALRALLRTLPVSLAKQSERIVRSHVEAAMREIDGRYASQLAASAGKWPRMKHTGNLRRGLRLNHIATSRFGVGYVLVNRAPHAWWYEHGTQARRSSTHPYLGKAPARPTFIPVVIEQRARMYQAIVDLLTSMGLRVTGSIGRAA